MQTTNPSVASDLGHLLTQAGSIVIALSAICGAFAWLAMPRIKDWLQREIATPVQEAHKSVTVNGGKNSPPTLMDKVGILDAQVKQIIAATGANAQRASDLADRMDDVHDLAVEARDLSKQTRDEFRVHEAEGEQYLGKVRVVMKTQGIELPDHREP